MVGVLTVLAVGVAAPLLSPQAVSAVAGTAWTIAGTSVSYVIGSPIPTLAGTASPSAGLSGSLTCNAFLTSDATWLTPKTLSSLAAGTYNIHCTGTAAAGYATTPSYTNGTLTVTGGQPFTCSPNFYQFATAGLFKLQTTPSFVFSAVTSSSARLNSIGWNPDDNYIYGLGTSGLYRIASNGSISLLGATSGVSPSTTGGDFYRVNGTGYLMSAASGAWTLTNPSTRVVTAMTDTGTAWAAYDLTIVGNKAYGIDILTSGVATLYIGTITSNGTLAGTTVDVTTRSITSGILGATGSTTVNTSAEHFGAAYSDGDGNAYFFSNTAADLFEVPSAQLASATPAATWLLNGGKSTIVAPNDGASCPTAASPTAPTMTTTASATSVTQSGGVIAGTITNTSATGQNVTSGNLQFCYAKTAALVVSAPTCVNSSPDVAAVSSSSLALSVTLSGLDPGAQYFFRSKATNVSGGTAYGTIENFTTLTAWTITAGTKSYTVGGTVPALDGSALPLAGLSGSLSCYVYPLADTTFLAGARLTINASLPVGDYLTHCTGTATAGFSTTPTLVNGLLRVSSLLSWQINSAGGSYTIGGAVPTLSGGADPLGGLNGSLTCVLYTAADTGYVTPKTIDSSLAAGSYVVRCTGTAASGYAAPAINNGVFTVSLAPWSITAANASYTNGSTVPTLTGTASPSGGLSGSLTCDPYLMTDTTYSTKLVINAEMTAGTYAIHCTGTAATGYEAASLFDARLTVSALTAWAITASSATYTLGGSVPTLTGSASPLGGLSGSLTCLAYDPTDVSFANAKTIDAALPVGTYTVHCTGSSAATYALSPTMNNSTLSVSANPWSITAVDATYVSGGVVPTLSGNATPSGGLSGSVTCRAYATSDATYQSPLTIDASLPASTYAIHCTGTAAATYASIPSYTNAVLTVSPAGAPIQYTVTYSANTGTGVASSVTQTFTLGDSALTFPTVNTLEKTGYTFKGWATSTGNSHGAGATVLSGTYTPTSSITLYAVWLPDTFTLTYDSNTADNPVATPSSQSFTVDGTALSLATVGSMAKVGYTFQGWSTTTAGSGGAAVSSPYTPSASVTLYAKWAINQYTITFNAHGGSVVPSTTVDHGSELVWPTVPTRAGYSFSGWSNTDGGEILGTFAATTPATLHAVWTRDQYTVTYVGNTADSGTASTVTQIFTVGDLALTLPTVGSLVKSGYSFQGWSATAGTSGAGGTRITTPFTPTASITLFARWTLNSYTVSFNSNGGSAVDPLTVEHGASLTFPANPVRDGYRFTGWSSTDGGALLDSYAVTGDATLYANWEITLMGLSTISGLVWLDINKNGVQDPDEPLLPGVTVSVTAKTTVPAALDMMPLGVNVATYRATHPVILKSFVSSLTVVTDANGRYTFVVSPGEYTLVAVLDNANLYKSSSGELDNTWTKTVTVESGGVDQSKFAASALGQLSLNARYVEGTTVPFAHAACHWYGLDGVMGTADDVLIVSTTDANGHVLMSGIPDGDFTCQAFDLRTGQLSLIDVGTIEPGAGAPLEMVLLLSGAGPATDELTTRFAELSDTNGSYGPILTAGSALILLGGLTAMLTGRRRRRSSRS